MTGLTNLRSPHWLSNRRTWRAARWVALAAAIPALWACNSNKLVEPTPAPQQTVNDLFQQSINRNIDIVFMIDDSSSMAPLQDKLTAQFPVFMDVLKKLPGGLPNLHIGVVSSSMGAGRNTSIAHCTLTQGNDQGLFHTKALGATCAQATLNAGQTFIANINGMANYTGDISDMFSCIAKLGDQGCGFEHQFESVLRALGADGAAAPPQNAGFLRPDAFLAVILITNEDDCSAPPDSDLFDSTSATITDPLGPLASYRCNEFGHLCGGQKPPRTPAGEVDLTGTCVSAEDGRLLKVADVVTAMKKLKPDPTKILVAAIAGPPRPYKVNLAPSMVKSDPTQWPFVEHSCVSSDGNTYADPSIRIQQWIDAFGSKGVFEEICNDSFAPALTVIATEIGKSLGSPCVTGKIVDTNGAPWTPTSATLPDCAVIDHRTNAANGQVIDSTLPACPAGTKMGPADCWFLDAGSMACPGAQAMGFYRAGGPVTTDLNSSVSCAVLACPPPGATNKPAGCP
jgi:hypothetical protein